MNKSVIACEDGLWHLHLWDPANIAGSQVRVPFRCRSWRHEGDCRLWKGAQDFVRCAEAIHANRHWSLMVLTFAKANWSSQWDQAKFGVLCWARLRKRLQREYGDYKYIQTWERHREGGLHVNVLIASLPIWVASGELERPTRWRWLKTNAVASGFGWRCSCEPVRETPEAISGYLNKFARELTGAGPKGQIPIDTPAHFRRLRSSRALLPPIHRSEYTGRLVQCPLESWGTVEADNLPRGLPPSGKVTSQAGKRKGKGE